MNNILKSAQQLDFNGILKMSRTRAKKIRVGINDGGSKKRGVAPGDQKPPETLRV
jgi:hypothetical protein